MQKFKIVLHNFTGKTENSSVTTGIAGQDSDSAIPSTSGEQLQLKNNYYLYSSTIGNNIVNDNNVRDFLDSDRNENITLAFVEYIKKNTTIEQFRVIFYDNKKLAAVFNDFYKNNVPGNNEISNQLKGTVDSNITVEKTNDNGNIYSLTTKTLLSKSNENSYFVPISVGINKKLIDDNTFLEYTKDTVDGSYEYINYFLVNGVNNNILYANTPYINSLKDADTLGFSAINNDSFGNFTVGLEQSFEKDNFFQAFNYAFQTISQFSKFMKFSPPKITLPNPGFYISQTALNFLSNSAKFSANSLLPFDKSTLSVVVPINIFMDNPSTGTTNLIIQAEPYSTAIIYSDFIMDDINPSLNYLSVAIPNGYNNIQTSIRVNNIIDSDESIILSLRSGITVVDLLVIRGEELIKINNYSPNQSIIVTKETKNRLMLRQFVDLNYNANESEYWKNGNIPIIQ